MVEHLSTVSPSSFRSLIPLLLRKSRQLSRQHMRTVSPSLKATARPYLHSLYLRHLFVMVILKDLMMKLTRDATSSTRIVLLLLVSWMQTDSLSLRDPKYIPVFTVELPSIFMLSTATVTRVSHVVLTISRRYHLLSSGPFL